MTLTEKSFCTVLVVIAITGLALVANPRRMTWTFSAGDYLSWGVPAPMELSERQVRNLGVVMLAFGVFSALLVAHHSNRYRDKRAPKRRGAVDR